MAELGLSLESVGAGDVGAGKLAERRLGRAGRDVVAEKAKPTVATLSRASMNARNGRWPSDPIRLRAAHVRGEMNTLRTRSFPTRLPLAAAGLALLVLQSGCVGGFGSVTSLPPLPDSLRVPPGSMVLVASPASRPTLTFAPASGRIGDPAFGAVECMRSVARAGAGSGEAAMVAFALLPGAALVGAITESGRQATPAQVEQINQDLDSRLRTAAGHGQLHGVFFDVARVRNDLEFTSVSGIGGFAFEDAGRSRRDGAGVSFLELGVEELHLRRQGLGDGCALEISVRVRLRRAGHAGPAYDQRVTFRSGVSDSNCWSADNARPLLRVADYGYRMIAEEISGRLFGGRK